MEYKAFGVVECFSTSLTRPLTAMTRHDRASMATVQDLLPGCEG